MRMYDIIKKKRDGFELSTQEINFFVKGYTQGKIPDEQMSALLMAIYFNDMTIRETTDLTMAMVKSGEVVDLSKIRGIKVDKHSTGGVGDKTSLIISPIVASCGVKIAKMSGRGLGHTGGTVDKLESIEGYKTTISETDFVKIVNEVGVSIIGQSINLAPADKKLYALRDITATVDKLPLIASSIMSKKIASNSDCILLDVKVGSGSFNKTIDDAKKLAKVMVDLGNLAGKKTMALITDMDIPLGKAIGNSLEVIECINTLKGNGPKDLTELCLALASNMLYISGKGSIAECEKLVKESIFDGSAFDVFVKMVKAHSGNVDFILDTNKFPKALHSYNVKSNFDGYITSIDTEKFGLASLLLGAGRNKKEDNIDHSAGILVEKKNGDYVKKDDIIATLFTSKNEKLPDAESIILSAIKFSDTQPIKKQIVLCKVE